MAVKYYHTVGRRKTAVARVWLQPHKTASFVVNDKPLETYFKTATLRAVAAKPTKQANLDKHFAIKVKVSGGGQSAQAGAVSHGVSRALVAFSPDLKPILKREKLLTRDARMKERRKFGLKKARKAPQWSKR